MKKTLLSITLLCFTLNLAYSQKAKVQSAYNYYKEPYQEYDKARAAIDEAIEDPQTRDSEKTWYYRGLIYHAFYKNPKYGNLCDHCLETAYQSFMKANEINPKNEWAAEINGVRIPLLGRDFFDRGIEEFKNKDYKNSLKSFEMVQTINPNDTSAIVNSAYAADRAGDTEKAKKNYNRLINMDMKDVNIYLSLSSIYKQERDTALALSAIREGRKVFPDTLSLMIAEINLLLATNRSVEASQALDAAVKKDPNNQSLYMALGSTYDNLANPKDASGKDLPKPINYSDYMTKAEQAYQKGLQINPNNYELNYNLGALYFNKAAEMANAANSIKSPEEFAKAKEKFEEKFKAAQPYLEKAMNLNPKKTSEDQAMFDETVVSLKQLYARTNQTDKYNLLPGKK